MEEAQQEHLLEWTSGNKQDDVKAPMWRILLLCTLALINELGYAVITAYVVPLLVAAGLRLKWASLSLMLGPLLALVSHGYIGHYSDHCQCSWGRRRPFILFFSILICIGFSATPFTPYLSAVSKEAAITLTITGVLFMLYGQAMPIRAYQLDCVPAKQVQLSNFIYTMFGGIGGSFGFTISALDWADILNKDINIINEAQGVCLITVATTIVCTICGLCSFEEVPYKLPAETLKDEAVKDDTFCIVCSIIKEAFVDAVKINVEIVAFIFCLSKEMWILVLTSFIGFTANNSFQYFFTTFVGESIYGGNPRAPQDTAAYQSYVEGVRMGSWGLAIGCVLLAVSSMLQDKLADWMGLKALYATFQCLFILASFGLTLHVLYSDNIIVVIVLGSLTGPYVGLFLSIPYTVVYRYEVSRLK